MEVGACSHIGRVREINEDSYYISDSNLPLYLIADGMGGHNAGEIASQSAIDIIRDYVLEKVGQTEYIDENLIPGILKDAITYANCEIFSKSMEEDGYHGMGTTLTVVLVLSEVYIGHVGDSRAYIIGRNEIKQLTQDHSLVAELLRNGSITEDEAKVHPQRNIITRALGTEESIKVDLYKIGLKSKEALVLCTDGLSNLVSPEEIKDVIQSSSQMQSACDQLVSLANERGGYDNITVVAIKKDY